MTQEVPILDFTEPAAGDLSALQFRAVDLDANGRAAQQTSAGGRVYGVLQNKPKAIDRDAVVRLAGITKWTAGAAIARGADVTVDASGRCITAATGNRRAGIARSAAGAAGDTISVVLGRDGVAP